MDTETQVTETVIEKQTAPMVTLELMVQVTQMIDVFAQLNKNAAELTARMGEMAVKLSGLEAIVDLEADKERVDEALKEANVKLSNIADAVRDIAGAVDELENADTEEVEP